MDAMNEGPVPGPTEALGRGGSAANAAPADASGGTAADVLVEGEGYAEGFGEVATIAGGIAPTEDETADADDATATTAQPVRSPLSDFGRRLVAAGVPRILATATGVFAVRAVVILATAAFAVHTLGDVSTFGTALSPGTRSIILSLFHWDSVEYLQVAVHGYVSSDPAQAAYFPLYPLMVRWLHDLIGVSYPHAALAISWTATYLLAVTACYLARNCLGFRNWSRVAVLLLWAPASFFFFSGYPESCEALLLTVVLILVYRQQFVWAALVCGVASALAPDGAFFVVPVIVGMVQGPPRGRRWTTVLAVAALSEIGIIVYSLYLRSVYGSVLAFVHAEKYWNRQLTYPFHGLFWTFNRMLHHQVLGNPPQNGNWVATYTIDNIVTVVATVALVYLVVKVGWRNLWRSPLLPSLALAALALLFNVSDATGGGVTSEALARHLGVLVPLFFAGAYLRRSETYSSILAGSVVMGTMAQILFCLGLWFT
jgi:hypothetical protein